MLETTPSPGAHDKEYLIQLLEFNNLQPAILRQMSFRKGLFITASEAYNLSLSKEMKLRCFRRRFHCGSNYSPCILKTPLGKRKTMLEAKRKEVTAEPHFLMKQHT